MRLRKAASDRKLSVCLCKNVGNTWFDIFGAKASCEKDQTGIVFYQKEKKHGKEQTEPVESVPRGLFGGMFGCS